MGLAIMAEPGKEYTLLFCQLRAVKHNFMEITDKMRERVGRSDEVTNNDTF